ncbi:hypothetical protein OG339_24815 [Streptosporangium sp. NBC_01495]|uniref:hypothetical protein n=1 Tax=Streptosporangium sp. NBC_01495 TaxID=2903899 RepID=UPI002E35AF32|nr:hypothetical protein [Streptosporangium sp. NBC_01495]
MTDQAISAGGPVTSLGLEAIMAAGWAVPESFTAEEFRRAEAFWQARRAEDERLLRVRAAAAHLVESWTGHPPRDVGSFGIQLNLETSDLDLGIGYPVADREKLMAALAPHAAFKGERHTRFTTTRLVFSFEVDGVEIDLSALTEEDFVVACRMLDEIDTGMSRQERIAHTWVKHLLRATGRTQEYAVWKLATYSRYCPEFNWVPISEPA